MALKMIVPKMRHENEKVNMLALTVRVDTLLSLSRTLSLSLSLSLSLFSDQPIRVGGLPPVPTGLTIPRRT